MKKLIFFAVFIALPFGIFNITNSKDAAAVSNAQSPVVLELFTSQSCSSCPPADKILSKLAVQNDNIIALSCNVTYWNHLHWEDTLSKEFCTDRQRQYVRALKSRGPYTPQMIVNGRHEMVGSRGAKINDAIAYDLKNNPLKPITLKIENNTLNITLPETPGNDSYALLLVIHGASHTQDIAKGENRGRVVHYTNPVKNITSLGTWDGTGKTMQTDISVFNNVRGYVVLAQKNGVTGHIIAAGKVTP